MNEGNATMYAGKNLADDCQPNKTPRKRKRMRRFSTFNIVCRVLLGIKMGGFVIAKAELNFATVFYIIASGIIVFVPVYKSQKKERENNKK